MNDWQFQPKDVVTDKIFLQEPSSHNWKGTLEECQYMIGYSQKDVAIICNCEKTSSSKDNIKTAAINDRILSVFVKRT